MAEEQQQQPINGAAAQPWYATFTDPDLRGTAENQRWETPEGAVKAYRELERLKGVPAERLLTLPDKPDDPEAMGKVYDRLGRPAKPEDYQLPVPTGFSDDFAKVAAPQLHKLGLSKAQAQGLAGWWNEYQQQTLAQMETERAQKSQVELQNLQREWGSAYKEREELGRQAVRKFGATPEDLSDIENAIGTARLLKLFANIGEQLGEHKFVEGAERPPEFGTSPDGAASRLKQLNADRDWVSRKLKNPDGPEAQEEDRLQRIMASGIVPGQPR